MILENGYETFTTFWDDFSVADKFGVDAVKDTFNRAFNEWKHNYKYLTELTLILNMKLWQWYNLGNKDLYMTYNECWCKCDEYGYKTLKGHELEYFLDILD